MLRLKLNPSKESLEVKLENIDSENEIRVWESWNSWGWDNFWFEVYKEGVSFEIIRINERDWTRNSPSYISIPSKGIHSIAIDFNDGTWIIPKELKENEIENLRIKAIFEIQQTPEALEHNVFIGKVESDLIKVNVKNKIEFTNQE